MRVLIRRFVVLVWAWPLLLPGASHNLEVKVLDTVKITESHYYGFFPSLHMLSTGELITAIKMDGDAHHIEANFWAFVISRDKGNTWGFRNTNGMVYKGEAAYTRTPLPDGSLRMLAGYMLPSNGDDYRNLHGVSVKIFDHGEGILFRRELRIHLPEPSFRQKLDGEIRHFASLGPGKLKHSAFVLFSGDLIRSRDGGWLTTMYGKFENDKYFRTFVVRSGNLKEWRYVTTIAGDAEAKLLPGEERTEGFTEPRMIRLSDGRLFTVMRRGDNNMAFKSWSADDGETWTKAVSIGFKGVKPALWLMKNGVLALSTGRPDPVTVYFSTDGGRSFTNPVVLARKRGTRYTDLVEVEPNKLLVVYDHVPFDWGVIPDDKPEAMNEIFGTFLKVTFD